MLRMLAKLNEEYAELCDIEQSTLDGRPVSNSMMEAADANVALITAFLQKNTVADATSAKCVCNVFPFQSENNVSSYIFQRKNS